MTRKKNKDLSKIPFISKELVESLDMRFPEQSPEVNWSVNEIMFKAGQRSVVRFLLTELELQQENIIEEN